MILLLAAIVFFSWDCSGNEWNGIKILKSTRSDAEKILGMPSPDSVAREAATYDTKDAEVFLRYSTGTCDVTTGRGEWNVPEMTVIGITVHPKTKPRLVDLHLDQSKYKKTPDSGIIHLVEYINLEAGITVVEDTSEGVVETIRYYPGTKDHTLRCKKQ